MTAQEEQASLEMQAIVTAAGGCWHEYHRKKIADQTHINLHPELCKCGIERRGSKVTEKNPSPTDLNVLFEYAEKLGLVVSLVQDPKTDSSAKVFNADGLCVVDRTHGNTTADALRKAICAAIKENNHE